MSRHTTFKFCLDPTVEQYEVLSRHAGAARFAFNQSLRIVKTALTQRGTDPNTDVPWTAFDLISAFNAWKKTKDAGQVFTVDTTGEVDTVVTGLAWRSEVCQQVFEQAAVDLSRGLKSWADWRSGKRKGKRVEFPCFKKKTGATPSFRLRNKHARGRPEAIRVGENNRPRSITLPGIGQVAVCDDTRRLRCMRAKGPARLGRHHHHIVNIRRHFLHQVSNALVKTHDRLVIENLNVSGMLTNHRLARAISDAGWGEFARLLTYKQAWRGGELLAADRWYPSSRLCPICGSVRSEMTLADRVITCGCGHHADRDTNAAVNLARWGQAHHKSSPDPRTPKQLGRANNARRRDGADQHPSSAGETSPVDVGTDVQAAPAA